MKLIETEKEYDYIWSYLLKNFQLYTFFLYVMGILDIETNNILYFKALKVKVYNSKIMDDNLTFIYYFFLSRMSYSTFSHPHYPIKLLGDFTQCIHVCLGWLKILKTIQF